MLFQRNSEVSAIRSFYISTGSGVQVRPIAYGPGSVINGSVMITLDKPISAYSIRVIFKCEETDQQKKENSVIFSVDTIIWGGGSASSDIVDLKPQELSSGSHMYLFAIKLPQVNYPPSMHDNTFGHRIHYTLQGVIDLISVPQHNTASIPILYLPLVTGDECQKARKTQIFQKEDKKIEVIAEVIKPAYCPGDLCTVKLITNNNSDTKISNVQISFNAIATTLAPTSAVEYIHKQHTLISETFFVSIAKHAKGHQDIFKLQLPSQLVPTFTNKLGKYIDISYEITVTIPITMHNTNSIFSTQQHLIAHTITLPVLIATVPPDYPIEVSVVQESSELPTFIPNIESPLPSPVSYPADRAYSVSPSNSFQLKDDSMETIDDDFTLIESSQHDASGHLMVPDNTRRKSDQQISVP